MTALAGAFTWDAAGAAFPMAERLAQASRSEADDPPRLVLRTERLACFALERASSAGRVDVWRGEDGSRCLVAGRLLGALPPRDAFRRALETEAGGAVDADGCWLALAERPGGAALRLHADPLGVAWLFVARWKDGCLFSGSYAALLQTLPQHPGLDEETALVTLALSYAPDGRTCARGVEMLPPGTNLEISARRTTPLARIAPPYGDRLAALDERAKHDRLEAVSREGVRAWCAGAPRPLALSLSGGTDSRLVMAHLLREEIDFGCVTFGHPRSPDVRAAQATARRAGRETRRYYRADETSWAGWTRTIERTGSTGGFQWSGWAEDWLAFVGANGRSGLLGFLGDAYSGKHLVEHPAGGGDWVENWATWSLDEGWIDSPLLTPPTRARMGDLVRSRFRDLVAGLPVAFPHQRALHLDLVGRQRRHVAAQIHLMNRAVDALPAFYTSAQVAFWSNLPWDDLRAQRLYLGYARSRFPRLFPAETRPGLPERAAGVARNLAVGIAPALRPWIAPPEIDLARHVRQHRERLRELFEGADPAVARWFDAPEVRRALASWPDPSLTAGQALRLANLLLVLRAGAPRSAAPVPAAGGA